MSRPRRAPGPGGLWLLAVAGILGAAGCAPELEDVDLKPPQVLSSNPTSGSTADTLTSVTVTFSEAIEPSTLLETEDTFVLVPTAEVTDTFIADLENPPLIDSRKALLVAGELTLSDDGLTLTFQPTAQLAGEISYTFIVSSAVTDKAFNPLSAPMVDEDGNAVTFHDEQPLVATSFRADFLTGPERDFDGPQVIAVIPEPDAENVPANLSEVQVTFDEPANGVTPTTFRLVEDSNGTAVTGTSVTLTADKVTATLSLSADLAVSTVYAVELSSDIMDGSGNRLDPIANRSTFTTAACLDTQAPTIDPTSITVQAADTSATITWTTDEPSTSETGHGLATPDTTTAGGAATCTGTYDACAVPTPDAGCTHRVRIEGLTASTTYTYVVRATDAGGNQSESAAATFTTAAPLPDIVINELMADPPPADEKTGEYIELYNNSDTAVDVLDWVLVESGGTTPKDNKIGDFGASGNTTIPARGYAIVVGSGYDPATYTGFTPDVTLGVYSTSTGSALSTLFGGLRNSSALVLDLQTDQGFSVSTYGGFFDGATAGVSIERVDPAGADVDTNWAEATGTPAYSPGAKNTVTP